MEFSGKTVYVVKATLNDRSTEPPTAMLAQLDSFYYVGLTACVVLSSVCDAV